MVDGVNQLYTNGNAAASTNLTAGGTMPLNGLTVRQTTFPLNLGGQPHISGQQYAGGFADGSMDEIRIWTMARTAQEIQANMSCRLTGDEAGLAAYWNFDTGSPVDLTTSGHDGSLAGGAAIAIVPGTDVIHAGCGECIPRGAQATAVVVNGFVVGIELVDGGCGYETVPTLRIVGGGGDGATATAVISNGAVVAVNVTNAGSGYTSSPRVLIESPPTVPSLEIAVSRVSVTLHVRVNHNYVVQSSFDFQTWTQVGDQFTADAETVTMEFEVLDTGRYFRIQEVP